MLAEYQHVVSEYLQPVVSPPTLGEISAISMAAKKKENYGSPSGYPEKDFLKEILSRSFVFILFLIAALSARVILDFIVVAFFGHHVPPHSVEVIIRTTALGIIAVNCALFTVHLINASKRLISHS
jgi:hypothetical protein